MTTAAELFCRDLAAGLAALGVASAAVSPGSRNAALSLAFEAEPGIDTTVHHDERSAAFFALGSAKAARLPAVLVCTSGTAAAHYSPAIIEARHARVPLVVITADRPPELRGASAPQTIDQIKLYGAAVKWFHEVGVPDDAIAARAADIALRAWVAASESPSGPVHLNVPLRDPMISGPTPEPTRVPNRPGLGTQRLSIRDRERLVDQASGRRGLLIAGGRPSGSFAAAARPLAAALRIPVIADPQARFTSPNVMGYGDLLASAGWLEQLSPDLVLRTGPLPTSKPLWRWLESGAVSQIYLDDGDWRDPLGSVTTAYRTDPAEALGAITDMVAPAPDDWLEAWLSADRTAGEAVEAALASEAFPNEPAIARAVYRSAPAATIVYAGSSMPIRDLDAVAGPTREGIEIMANRGANGIDGLLSAAGGAARTTGRPVIVHAGDLSVVHDAGGLGTLARLGLPVTVVVVDNDGGGIFHFLPQAEPASVPADRFEKVFGAPHGLDLTKIAEAYGVRATTVATITDLEAAIADPPAAPYLVRVQTDRAGNVAVHERLRAAVRGRLAG